MSSEHTRIRLGPFMIYIWNCKAGTIRDSHSNQIIRRGVDTVGKNDDGLLPGHRNNRNNVNQTRNSIGLLVNGSYNLITPDNDNILVTTEKYPTVRKLQEGFYTFVYLEDTEYLCLLPWTKKALYWERTNYYEDAGKTINLEAHTMNQYFFIGCGDVEISTLGLYNKNYKLFVIPPGKEISITTKTRIHAVHIKEPINVAI